MTGHARVRLVTGAATVGAVFAVAAAPHLSAPAGATTATAFNALVSSSPAAPTPNLKTGTSVYADVVIGGTVYAGGRFSQFANAAGTITYSRDNLIAYSVSTGRVLPLSLTFDGDVRALAASPDGSALYVGGAFSTVAGIRTGALARVNLGTGKLDRTFRWSLGGRVSGLRYANGRLYVGGTFPKRLVAVDPRTGADTRTVEVSVTGRLATTTATRVAKIAINPAGTDLVAIGNFTTVDGKARKAAFRLHLGTSSATLSTWHPARFNVTCSVHNWPRDVAWSPSGAYFVIVGSGGASGGYPAHGFCDAAGRWEASSSGSIANPTWINWTGGDSLYTVAVSSAAVYVGGHNRWLDNPYGVNSAGRGAYEVDSVGAIDPATGLAIRTWNARFMDRRHGKQDLTLYPGGLVVGGDGTYLKGAYHKGTGIFLLSGTS